MGSIASAERFSVLVILRREFLDITGNFCAAKLIEYFKHWTKWKVKNHRTPWVYQPLKKIYADLMGEHSLHVIRAAIALLEEMKIITKQKNPGNKQDRTWQYKLNFDVLNQLLEHGTGKTDGGTFNVEQYHRSNPEASKPQQHDAVELKKTDEVEPEIREQAPGTHFVDEPELDYSTNETDPHEGNFSAPAGDVQKPSDAIVSESAAVSQHVDEQQLDLTDEDEENAPGGKPSKREIAEICTELRRLRINPQVCLGVVRKHWGNVAGAIARVKEAFADGWCENPTGLFINSCKSGAKGKNVVTTEVSAWFRWAYSKRIVGAMSGGMAYTPDGEPVDLQVMMRRYPMRE